MTVKTVSKLVAKIGFDVDLSGLTKFHQGISSALSGINKLTLGLSAVSIALAKFIEKQGHSATFSQVQSAYYDIQQKQLLGLSLAYKAVGGSIQTHLNALKQFQNIQGNLLLGKIDTQAIQALAVSGSSSLINTMFYGKLSDFEKGVTARYDFLRSQHTKYTDRQANLLRQQFGQQINDEHQRQILERASGLPYQEAIDRAKFLKYGTGSNSGITAIQYRLQSFSYRMGMIGAALEGIFIHIADGFTRAFSTKDLDTFTNDLVAFGPTAIKIGQDIGYVFKGIAYVFESILSAFEGLSDVIDSHGPAMKDTLIAIGAAMAILIPIGIIARIGLMIASIIKLTAAMLGLKNIGSGIIEKDAVKEAAAAEAATGATAAEAGAATAAGGATAAEAGAATAAGGAALSLAPLAIGALAGITIGNAITTKHKAIHNYIQNTNNPLISLNARDSYAHRQELIEKHNHVNNIHVHVANSNANADDIGHSIAHHLGIAHSASDNQRAN